MNYSEIELISELKKRNSDAFEFFMKEYTKPVYYLTYTILNNMGRPLTKYTTDAPAGKKLTVTLPSIVVAGEKSLSLKVDIPSKNEKQAIPQTLDLGLQKMQLDSIERTSDTTAQLHFTLNTGEDKNVRIWEAFLDSPTLEATESLWENGVCVLDVTFPSGTSALELLIASPTFIIDGNWILEIQ